MEKEKFEKWKDALKEAAEEILADRWEAFTFPEPAKVPVEFFCGENCPFQEPNRGTCFVSPCPASISFFKNF